MAAASCQFDQLIASLGPAKREVRDPKHSGLRWNWTREGIYPRIVLPINGKATQVAVGSKTMKPKQGDGVKLLNEHRVKKDRGQISSGTHTFAMAFDETNADMKSKVSVGVYSYAYAYKTFPNSYAKHLASQALTRKKLDHVNAADIRAVIAAMRTAKKEESTINGVVTVIRTTFKFARSNGWTTNDPFVMLGKKDLPDQRKRRKTFAATTLRADELRKLIEATIESWTTAVTVLVYTGMRASEAIGLHWRDVNLVEGWINVQTQLVRTEDDDDLDAIIDGKTKSKNSVRSIPLTSEAQAALMAQLEYEVKQGRGQTDDWVFTCANGSPRSTHNLRRALVNAGRRAGLGHVTPQDLRRSFCTLAANAGVNDHHAAQVAGHAVAVYRDSYVQKSEQKEHALAVVNGIFG